MPRAVVDLSYHVDYLSILDENGNLDRDLEPDMPDDLLLKLYNYMLLGRRMDERMLIMQRQGRIGGFAPIRGMEASHLGAIAAINDSDWFVPQLREAAAEFWRAARWRAFYFSIMATKKASRSPPNRTICQLASS